jgi:ligand-binding sensor domain-containing protein
VAAAPTGQVWAVGADGLFRFDGQAWQTFSLPDPLREQILTSQMGPYYVVTDLAIAPNDVVWVGTFQDGLYRFESGTWTHYTTAEGLVDNMIVGLAVDPQNNLWVCGPYTLSRFDGQAWQVVPIDGHAQMSSKLTSLAITPAGQVWVAVEQEGAYQFDGQSWTGHSQGSREDWNEILAAVNMFLTAGPNEQVWLGTDGGWLRWTGADWQGLNVTIPAPFARPLAVDSAGGAWGRATSACYFCSLPDLNENGAVYVTPDLACRFTAADGLGGAPLDPPPASSDYETPRPDEVWGIAVDADGAVWFITQGQITVFRPQGPICDYAAPQAVRTPPPTPTAIPAPPPGRWRTYTTADGLADNDVKVIAVEENGHIWVGAYYGVSEYDGQTWQTYTTADGLADDDILSITIDEAGHKWFATSNGVSEFDGQTWTTYTTTDGLANDTVHAIVLDEAGHKWFATSGGVSEFDGQTWTSYTQANGLAHNRVYALTIDRAGHIWAGTQEGVSEYDGQTWRTYNTADGLVGNSVNAIAVEGNGHIWVGAYYGVSEYDGQIWRTYTTADGLANNWVLAVAIDKAGAKWFGTTGGVSKFDGQTWATYTPTNAGLPDERIKAIVIDGAGHKWFGTLYGLSEFDDNP